MTAFTPITLNQSTHTETIVGALDGIRGTVEVAGKHFPIPARKSVTPAAINTTEFDKAIASHNRIMQMFGHAK